MQIKSNFSKTICGPFDFFFVFHAFNGFGDVIKKNLFFYFLNFVFFCLLNLCIGINDNKSYFFLSPASSKSKSRYFDIKCFYISFLFWLPHQTGKNYYTKRPKKKKTVSIGPPRVSYRLYMYVINRMWSSRLIWNGQSNGWGNVKNIKVKPLPLKWMYEEMECITVVYIYGKHHTYI